jgi:hypothetical protein
MVTLQSKPYLRVVGLRVVLMYFELFECLLRHLCAMHFAKLKANIYIYIQSKKNKKKRKKKEKRDGCRNLPTPSNIYIYRFAPSAAWRP